MTGVSGNVYTLAIGKQTAKGVPQTTPTYKLKVTGGDISPNRQEIQLNETDATRQQGKTLIVGSGIAGSPDFYVRPDDFGLLAYGLLGANANSGTAVNYIHTATMINSGSLPYFTIYKAIGNTVLVDRYSDCVIQSMKVSGQAGGALSVSCEIAGLSALLGQTDPVLAVVSQDPLVYPQVIVQKGGQTPGQCESFEININNNAGPLNGDNSLTPYDIVPGQLDVSGTMTMLFNDDTDYRAFHTGTTTGTALGTTLFTQPLTIIAQSTANLLCQFRFANVAYTAYPVAPDPGGAPIKVAIGWRVMPDPVLANYCEITTKNAVATY